MKPSPNNKHNRQKFPFVDYCYHAPMLNGTSIPRVKKSNSLRDISRDYFDGEANREFTTDAAVFGSLIVGALVPIMAGISAVAHLIRALPLF